MNRLFTPLLGWLGGLSCLLVGCSASTDVALTGNTPSQYSHVWVTVKEVDFNSSASAGPTDGGWQSFPFSTPSTVDLVALNGGNFGSIANGLMVEPGTYSQMRLIPVDASAPLAQSAQNAGALYNSEADYVDSSGTTHQLPLELLNPEQGLSIKTSLKVPIGNIGAAVAGSALGAGTTGTSPFGTTAFGNGTGTTGFGTNAFGTNTNTFGNTFGTNTFGTNTNTFGNTFGTNTFGTNTNTFGNTFGSNAFGTNTNTFGSNAFGTNTNAFGSSTGTGFGFGSTSGSLTNQTFNAFVVSFDGNSDLVPFNCNSSTSSTAAACSGILLSQHATAYDLSRSAAISGQLTLTNITNANSGLPAIQVSAQTLSADGTRHVVVSSTSVQSDGTFMLYPLAADTNGVFYDVVIHGPGIATMIIKSVEVALPSTSTNSFFNNNNTNTLGANNTLGTTSTTGTPIGTAVGTPIGTAVGTPIGTAVGTPIGTATGTPIGTVTGTPVGTVTGTTTTGTPIVSTTGTTTGTIGGTTTGTSGIGLTSTGNIVVSIGTLTPRAASSYTANVSTAAGSPLPAGARVEFYQTLARAGEVPYVIETAALDPFNQKLFNPQELSTGTVDSGTWSTSTGAVTLVSAAPAEKAGTYRVAATAPSFNDGSLSPMVSAPSSGTATVALPTLTLPSGTSSGTVSADVAPVTPGRFDQGALLLSYNGTLVAATSLSKAVLAQGGTVTVTGVPAETPSSLYFATVRVWNSSNPALAPSGTLQLQSFPTPIDLRSSTHGSIKLTLN